MKFFAYGYKVSYWQFVLPCFVSPVLSFGYAYFFSHFFLRYLSFLSKLLKSVDVFHFDFVPPLVFFHKYFIPQKFRVDNSQICSVYLPCHYRCVGTWEVRLMWKVFLGDECIGRYYSERNAKLAVAKFAWHRGIDPSDFIIVITGK